MYNRNSFYYQYKHLDEQLEAFDSYLKILDLLSGYAPTKIWNFKTHDNR